MRRRGIALLAVAVPMAAAMVAGAVRGYPVFDDAYYLMALREGAARDFVAQHRDRPVYGALLQAAANTFGRAEAPCVALAVGFWALLAWQTHRLWKHLFPEQAELSPLAAALAFAPLLVEIQFTTVTTVFPVILPVTLCLAAVLILLARRPDETPRDWIIAAILTALAALISEYAIAAAAACGALLIGLRRFRSASVIALSAGLGYLAFRLVADISDRPKVDSAARLGEALASLWTTLSQWVSALAYTLAGAYGRAISEFRLDWDSRGTWIAALAGAVAAAGAAAWLRPPQALAPSGERSRHLFALLFAVALGLGVVVLANSNPLSADPYRSRYRLPVVPFAVVATLAALDRVVRPRYRAVVFASLAFLAAWRMADGAFRVRREQLLMEDVGRRLLPLVQGSNGLVIGVVPDQQMLAYSDITPKVTKRWTDRDSGRVLVLPHSEAEEVIGIRLACLSPDTIDLRVKRDSGVRYGSLDVLVWVPIGKHGAGTPEPYCLAPEH